MPGGVDGAKAERAEHMCARPSTHKDARRPRCLISPKVESGTASPWAGPSGAAEPVFLQGVV